ncbi:MAG: glycosyltransferase family 2 protein [Bacteroidetes bacterium]|nr:glycosyltransferase family 2 protein [Bacteroidota bacterium]
MNNSRNNNKVAAVIPFYNESKTINRIVLETLKYVSFVIAVDDGSTDGSPDNIPITENVTLISYKKNCGKGYALRKGLEKGIEKGFLKLVTIDADSQHDPEEIHKLISGLTNYDIVIGNRLNDLKGMPLQRRISNKITSFLLSIKTGQKILDSQCGFRAYRADVVKKITTVEDGYEAETEILIKASRHGYKIGFANVSTIYGDEESKMMPIKTTFGFIKLLFT